jgi:hypothetical protein
MLNHPVTSVQNGARWRQESLQKDVAHVRVHDEIKTRARWNLLIPAIVLAFFGSGSQMA